MSQSNLFPINFSFIDYISQLIQYRQNQIDYYRHLIEQHAQNQCFQRQFLRQFAASNALAQFNESFKKNFPQFMANQVNLDNQQAVHQSVISIKTETNVDKTLNENVIEIDSEDPDDAQQKFQTLSLSCLFWPDCTQHFTNKVKLECHLQVDHRIFPFRCLHRNCEQTFINSQMLNHHFQTVHSHLAKWQCSKCPRKYQNHARLQYHNRSHHLSGKFACSYPECDFIGQYRSDLYSHYEMSHQTYHCDQRECGKSFGKANHLKTHKRVHLSIKPYRCKWPDCLYASEDRSNTIKHIRIRHFKLPITKKEQENKKIVDQRNPKNYLKVVSSLLK